MTDVLPLNRDRPRGPAIHVRYEKAGRWLEAAPVPWNADAVMVEASMRLTVAARHRSQFSLRFPGLDPIPPDSLHCDGGDRHRLAFALPVPPAAAEGKLFWKGYPIAKVEVPVLAAEEFLASLEATLPTIFVKLGTQFVSASAFVASQCTGLTASLVLRSPFTLAGFADLGLAVAIRNERTGAEQVVPVALSGAQLASTEATVTLALPRSRRRSGAWSVAWLAGDRELSRQYLRTVPMARFERSLQVADTRFLVADKLGRTRLVNQLPHTERGPFGPCFLLASAEPGIAAIATVRIVAAGPHAVESATEVNAIVTDGVSPVSPGLFDVARLPGTTGFELRLRNRLLASLSLSPVPAAKITAEGGFVAPPEFPWTGVADEELSERLNRLADDS